MVSIATWSGSAIVTEWGDVSAAAQQRRLTSQSLNCNSHHVVFTHRNRPGTVIPPTTVRGRCLTHACAGGEAWKKGQPHNNKTNVRRMRRGGRGVDQRLGRNESLTTNKGRKRKGPGKPIRERVQSEKKNTKELNVKRG